MYVKIYQGYSLRFKLINIFPLILGMMPPSPSKSKGIHKSSGKLFRHKDKERAGSSGSSGSTGNNGSNNSNNSSSNNSSSSSSSTSGSSSTTGKRDDPMELKDCPLSLPVVGSLDHARSLPRYTSRKSLVPAPTERGEMLFVTPTDVCTVFI